MIIIDDVILGGAFMQILAQAFGEAVPVCSSFGLVGEDVADAVYITFPAKPLHFLSKFDQNLWSAQLFAR